MVAVATLSLALYAPGEMTAELRRELLARTRGTIIGVVRDAATNQPLPDVYVSTQHSGDSTDARGAFEIIYVESGEVTITASRRDLIDRTARVHIVAASSATVDLSMERAPPPCCRLAGVWSVRLALGDKEATGTLSFSPKTPDPFPERREHLPPDDSTVDEFGVYDVDLRPILGDDITRSTTNTIFGGGLENSEILTEAEGFVHHENHVEITFIPRMSHGGISLGGTIGGDEIRGEWIKRDYDPIYSGTFVMRRMGR